MSARLLRNLVVAALALAGLSLPALAQVPYQRIVNAANTPEDWLTYSGNYNGQRYSPNQPQ